MRKPYIFYLFLLSVSASFLLALLPQVSYAQTEESKAQQESSPLGTPKKSKKSYRKKSSLNKTRTVSKKRPEPFSKKRKERIIVTDTFPGKGIEGSYHKILLREGENRTAQKLSEIMESQSGVRVNRFGAPGSYSTLSIRGASPEQTAIYIDGIAVNDPLGGAVNLENLPLALFSSLELYRSHTPLHLGGIYPGGALDLVPQSLKANEKLYFIDSSATSLGGGGLGLGLRLPWALQYLKVEGSKNRYKYYDDKGTPLFNKDDDCICERKNEDYASWGYTGYFSFTRKEQKLKALLDLFQKERGLPGPIGAPLHKVRFKEQRGIAKISYRSPLPFLREKALLSASLGASLGKSETNDPVKELSSFLQEQKYSSQRREFNLSPAFYFFDDRLALGGLYHRGQSRLKRNEESLAKRNGEELAFSLHYRGPGWGQILIQEKRIVIKDIPYQALQDSLVFIPNIESRKYRLRSGMLRLGLSVLEILEFRRAPFLEKAPPRAQNLELEKKNPLINKTPNKVQSNKSSASLFPLPTRYLELYASYSHSVRAPSISEAYGDGAFLLANPLLLPEDSINQSYGIESRFKISKTNIALRSAYFYTRSKKLIILIQNSPRTLKAENLSAAIIKGIEGEIKLSHFPYIVSLLRLTYLNTKDNGKIPFYKDKRLPFQPRYSLEYYLESGSKNLRPFIKLHALGSLYRDRANSTSKFVSERYRFDGGFHYYFGKKERTRLSFIIKNINGEYHSDRIGFPLPDRTYEIQFYKEVNLM